MVSHMIDRALKAGCIKRTLDEQDSRRFCLSLTDEGDQLVHRINEHYLKRIQSSGLQAEEIEQLSQQLTQLASAFLAIEDIE